MSLTNGDTANHTVPTSKEEAAAQSEAHGWNSLTVDTEVTSAPVSEWASNPIRYEYYGDAGDIGPPNENLERALFSLDFRHVQGEHMEGYNVAWKVEGPEESSKEVAARAVLKWEDAGFHPQLLNNLELCHFLQPTPVQAATISLINDHRDILVTAQTGSGKTVAYLAPTLSKFMGKVKKLCKPRPNPATFDRLNDRIRAEPVILIVVPTRELAAQIFDEVRRLSYRSMLRPCVLYGGGPTRIQLEELEKGCDILIGTPGRIIDCMNRPGVLGMNRVKVTIIDEADEVLKGDWIEDTKKIIMGNDANDDDDHQFMMFSATFPDDIRKAADEFLAPDRVIVHVGRIGATHKNVSQAIIFTDPAMKKAALYDLLMSRDPARTVIFCNSKGCAEEIDDFLYTQSLPVTLIHSGLTQREREDAVRAFKIGSAPLLVCTGVAARGLDIKSIMHVVNYELPTVAQGGIDEYVHRIGRTARIGHKGFASSFYTDRNVDLAPDLVKLLKECDQEVPDFLTEHDSENAGAVETDDIVWGDADPGNGDTAVADNTDGDAWGGAEQSNEGFKADAGGSGSGWN